MLQVTMDKINKYYGSNLILDDISLRIIEGEKIEADYEGLLEEMFELEELLS